MKIPPTPTPTQKKKEKKLGRGGNSSLVKVGMEILYMMTVTIGKEQRDYAG